MTRLVIILIGILLLLTTGVFALATASGSTPRTEIFDVPRGDATDATVELSLAAGRIEVGRLAMADDVALAGRVGLAARQDLHGRVEAGRDLRIRYRSTDRLGITFGKRGPSWDVDLNPELPTTLKVRAGAADGTYDLRGTTVVDLQLSTDVGRQVVYLARDTRDATVRTDVGRITVYVPGDAAARVIVDRGVRLVDASDAFTSTGRTYQLAGGGMPLTLRVGAEMGTVTLRTHDGAASHGTATARSMPDPDVRLESSGTALGHPAVP